MKPFPYITYRPKDCSNGLIVAFHGWGQSVRKAQSWGLDAVAKAAKCQIVYPKGDWRNWGGISAKKPRYSDVLRLGETLRHLTLAEGLPISLHLVGFSDGASFSIYAAKCLTRETFWPVCSATSYSGFYQAVPNTLADSAQAYPILLLRNIGERLVRDAHQQDIRAAYEDRGHIVTYREFPRRRRWFKHHYWRSAEANPIVLRHIVDSMSQSPVSTGAIP